MACRQRSSPAGSSTQRHRPGSFPGRRTALWLAGLTMAVIVATPISTAGASSDPNLVEATVYTPDSTQVEPVTFSDLQEQPTYAGPSTMEQYDASGRNTPAELEPYAVIPGQGGTGTWPLSSVAAAAVLTATGQIVAPGEISSITVVNDAATPETPLSAGDIATPSDFEDPDESPVITDFGGYEDYYRPRRDSGDANALDRVGDNEINAANEDTPIDIEITLAGSLQVSISAPQTSVTAGAMMTFSSNSNAPAGDPITYAWTLGGSAEGTGSSQTLSFPAAGQFTVGLEVTDTSTGKSGGATVSVTVNPASGAPTTPQTGTSTLPVSGTGSAASGPSQSTGTAPGASAGTQTTPSPAGAGATQTHTTGSGTTATGTTAHTTTSAATPVPAQGSGGRGTPTPSQSSGTDTGRNAGTGGRGSAGGTAAASATGTGATVTAPARTHTPPSTQTAPARAAPRSHTRLISGVLVSDIVPAAGAGAGSAASGGTGHAPGLAAAGHHSILVACVAGFGALLLLGLGVGRELRGRRFVPRWIRSPTA